MKDHLGPEAIRRLAANLSRASAEFPAEDFVASATDGLAALELKARIGHVSAALRKHLPTDYLTALAVLVHAGKDWDRGDPNDAFRGFAVWPVFRFIQDHGLAHPVESLEALRRLTGLFSAEFAVRPYLNQDPAGVFATLRTWTTDPDSDVRRLVSECTRPRLPWATRVPALDADPTPIFDLLARLIDDDVPYVRRSVANNLSDLCKTHPDRVLDLCETWLATPTEGRRWIVTRATRNLVKEGHPRVWPLLGFTAVPAVAVEDLEVPTSLTLGDTLQLKFQLRSLSDTAQRLVVDFVLHHRKANGRTAPKVFKLKNVALPPRGVLSVSKRHAMRPITTRRYYPGAHRVEITVNGVVHGESTFALQISDAVAG